MKTWIAAIVVGVALVASSAQAEDGKVSQDTLASFGLGGMQTMSDSEGKAVRGKFAFAYGGSSATFLNATSSNVYGASGNYLAGGATESVAGLQGSVVINNVSVGPLGVVLGGSITNFNFNIGAYAGGAAQAYGF